MHGILDGKSKRIDNPDRGTDVKVAWRLTPFEWFDSTPLIDSGKELSEIPPMVIA